MDRTTVVKTLVELKPQLVPVTDKLVSAGSFRRRSPDPTDIDIVAVSKKLLLHQWLRDPFVIKKYECRGGDKQRKLIVNGVQVELYIANATNFGWILFIRTGSQEYVHDFLTRLNRDKKIHSEGGWLVDKTHPKPKFIDTPEEEDVFAVAGIPYVEPWKRN